MPAEFDPYFKLLGIPPEEQPPHYYRLLGLSKPFEADLEVIDTCSNRVVASLRKLQSGPRAEIVNKLLNEVATARLMLLNPVKKQAYDDWLRSKLKAAEEEKQGADSRRKQRLLIGIGVLAVAVIGVGIGGWIVFSTEPEPAAKPGTVAAKKKRSPPRTQEPAEQSTPEIARTSPEVPANKIAAAPPTAPEPVVNMPTTTEGVVVRHRSHLFDASKWERPVLPRLDPELDGSPGGWSKASDGTLVSSAAPAALSLPYAVPSEEYVLELDLEPRDIKAAGLWIILPTKTRPVVFGIGVGNPPRTGILVDGFALEQQPLLCPPDVTLGPPGQPTRLLVGVVQNGAYVGFNNNQVFGWRGDLRRLPATLPNDLPGRPDRIVVHTKGSYQLSQVTAKASPGAPFGTPEEIAVSPDLLAVIDVERDAQRGQWYWSNTEPVQLLAPHQPGSRLQLPIQPPEQFDFFVTATLPADGALVVGLPWQKRTVHAVVSSKKIDIRGYVPLELAADMLPPDQPVELVFKCRKEGIEIGRGNEVLAQAKLDTSASVVPDEFLLPWLTPEEKRRPFLGTIAAGYSVSAVRVQAKGDTLAATTDAKTLKVLEGAEKPPTAEAMPEKVAAVSKPELTVPAPALKSPVPSEAERQAALDAVLKRYSKKVEKAVKPPEIAALAMNFRDLARNELLGSSLQYALLQRSREMAVQTGEPILALQICDRLTELFDIDSQQLKFETISALAKTTKVLGKIRYLLESLVLEMWRVSDLGREKMAIELSEIGIGLAVRAKDKTTVETMRLFKQDVSNVNFHNYDDYQKARRELETDPTNIYMALLCQESAR